MGIKKIAIFVVSTVLILNLNIVNLYAEKGTPAVGINTAANVTVNNAEEFRASIYAAMKEVKDVVKVKTVKYDKSVFEINSAVSKIMNDSAELFYVKDCISSWAPDKDKSSGTITININYMYPKDKIIQMKNELNSKIDSIINKEVQMDMSSSTKELMLHDYIVMNTTYKSEESSSDSSLTELINRLKDLGSTLNGSSDSGVGSVPGELSTSYSVLVKGRGDDRGYARAMKQLLNKVGIECMVVEGTEYTWNIVKVEGDYYHLDASADKMNNEEEIEVLTHDYFNIPDLEMTKYYEWDKSKYPACTSNKCNYFYKNNTIVNTVDEFEAQTKKAIEEVKDSISIRVTKFDSNVYNISDTIISILNGNPILDDISEWYWVENDNLGTVNVIFKYDYSKSEILSKRQETEKKADEIFKAVIKPGMGEYAKVLIIHDYIIRNASYDKQNMDKDTVPPDEHDAYGVLVKGIGVCDSYAEAMKLLLDKAGVECMIVEGDGAGAYTDDSNDIGHAWNIVKVDSNYYHIDATWDDENLDGKERVVYNFFNVNDEEMKKTHTWDQGKYPTCTSTEANYFYKNKLVAHNYNDAVTMIKNTLRGKRPSLIMKATDYNDAKYDIDDMIGKAFDKSGISRISGGRWMVNAELGIIEMEFEY